MPDNNVSTSWVQGVAQVLEATGLDMERLRRNAGIDDLELARPDARIPAEKVNLLWTLAVRQSNNPVIGLTQSLVTRPAIFGPLGYAMMSSPNLLSGMERMVRFVPLVSGAAVVNLRSAGQGVRLVLELFGGSGPVPRQSLDHALATVLVFFKWLMGQAVQPVAAEMICPPPRDLTPYTRVFTVPVRFNAEENALVFARSDMTRLLPTSDTVMAEHHEHILVDRLERLVGRLTRLRARQVILGRMSGGELGRKLVAKSLGMSERTFRRRLREEGVSYQDLLDEARRDLALRLLGQTGQPLAETAFRLGFTDRSSFYRACKRWFGCAPGEFRNALMDNDRMMKATSC